MLAGEPSTLGARTPPARPVVLGAGRQAALAGALACARAGAEVTLLHRERPGYDASGLVRRAYAARLEREGVRSPARPAALAHRGGRALGGRRGRRGIRRGGRLRDRRPARPRQGGGARPARRRGRRRGRRARAARHHRRRRRGPRGRRRVRRAALRQTMRIGRASTRSSPKAVPASAYAGAVAHLAVHEGERLLGALEPEDVDGRAHGRQPPRVRARDLEQLLVPQRPRLGDDLAIAGRRARRRAPPVVERGSSGRNVSSLTASASHPRRRRTRRSVRSSPNRLLSIRRVLVGGDGAEIVLGGECVVHRARLSNEISEQASKPG